MSPEMPPDQGLKAFFIRHALRCWDFLNNGSIFYDMGQQLEMSRSGSLMGISVEQNTYIYDMWAENGGFLNSDYSD